MSDNKKDCSTCRFGVARGRCWISQLARSVDRCECHKNPPVVLHNTYLGQFPIVDLPNWCGEYKLNKRAKIKKQHQAPMKERAHHESTKTESVT